MIFEVLAEPMTDVKVAAVLDIDVAKCSALMAASAGGGPDVCDSIVQLLNLVIMAASSGQPDVCHRVEGESMVQLPDHDKYEDD